jgi:hypothetical protein
VKPVQHLSEAIFRKKYGDEKLQQRIKYREPGAGHCGARTASRRRRNDGKGPLFCSFCGELNTEVEAMVAGPCVLICNECVDLCNGVIAERRSKNEKPAGEIAR